MTSLFGKLREAMGFHDPVEDFDSDYTEFDGQDYRSLYERERAMGRSYGASHDFENDYGNTEVAHDFTSRRRRPSQSQETVPATDWSSKVRSSRSTRERSTGGSPTVSAGKVIGLPGLPQAGSEVIVVEPRAFEEMADVLQTLRDRKTVVMNLTLMDPADAQRSVDFVAGGTYAIDGHQERIGENIFLFTPSCVSVTTPGSAQPAAPASPESFTHPPHEEHVPAWPVAAIG